MPSTPEQAMVLEDAVLACLEAGDSEEDVLARCDHAISLWRDNHDGEDGEAA